MGLLDEFLSQQGVNQTPQWELDGFNELHDNKDWEVRFDNEGNPYQSVVSTPLIQGHTRENQGPMFDLPKVEAPIETSSLNYGDDYYNETVQPPQQYSVGTNTGIQTQHGRDVYKTDTGDRVSEISVTVPIDGKWVNAPSIQNGVQLSEEQVVQGIIQGAINPTSIHNTVQEAVSVAQSRSDNIGTNAVDPMDLYNRQGRADYTPQNIVDNNTVFGEPSLGALPNQTERAYSEEQWYEEQQRQAQIEAKLQELLKMQGMTDPRESMMQDVGYPAAGPMSPSTSPDTLESLQQAQTQHKQDWLDTDDFGNTTDNYEEGVASSIDRLNRFQWDTSPKDIPPEDEIDVFGILGETDELVNNNNDKPEYPSHLTPYAIKLLEEQRTRGEFWDGVGDTASDVFDGTVGGIGKDWYRNLSNAANVDVETYSGDQDVSGLMRQNFGQDFSEIVKGGVDALMSPVETADAIASLVSGAVQHTLPDDMAWNEDSKNMASAVADIYVERYGSLEGFKKALSENPAEVLSELLGVGLITKAGVVKLKQKIQQNPDFIRDLNLGETIHKGLAKALPGMKKEMFVGGKAVKSLNKQTPLNQAKKLEKLGSSKNDIWKATGFIKGQDGNYRFELDDSKMILNKNIDLEQFTVGGISSFTLERFIDYPELFLAYPQLKTLNIKIDNMVDPDTAYASDGGMEGSNAEIVLSPSGNIKSQLPHEIQHMVQTIEGHAVGGSPSGELLNILTSDKKYGKLVRRQRVLEREGKPIKSFLNEGTPTYSSLYEAGLIDLQTLKENGHFIEGKELNVYRDKANTRLDEIYKEWDVVTDDIKVIDESATMDKGFVNYQKLGGEAEAREVQNRLNMSAKERRELLPTWDGVPDDDVILRFDSNIVFNSTKGNKVDGGLLGQAGKFDKSKTDASEIFGNGAERIRYTDPNSGGTIEVVTKKDGSASVLELIVPEEFRGKGIGQALQKQVMDDFPKMGGQVSSKAAAKTAYRLGRRPIGNPNATLDDVFKIIDENSSVNLVSKDSQIGGLLGQTPVKYPKTLRGNIMRLTDESDKLKELRGTDITQRTLDRISDIEAEIFELEPLIVQHNLDSSGLLLMDEMGGTPMPSMAISKVEHPLSGFGDISLLGDSDMAIPSAKNPIHDADTYSGRQPRMFTQYADVDSVYKMVDNNKDISHFSDFWIFDAQDAADLEIKLSIVEGMKAQGFNPKNYKSYSAMKTDFWEKTGKSSYDLAEEFKIDSLGEIEQVFTPNPMYTPSGNRRKLRPYNLDEVHRQMKKDKAWIPGTEVPTGSAGRARAMSANLFKTITEIKNSRGRLASHDDMKTIKADFERVYLSVFEPIESIPEVAKRIKDTEYSEMFINGLIDDVLNGDSLSWADLSAETVDIVRKIILPIKRKADDIQTEYFEIKPKGTKKLTDFKGAIIPRHETTAEKILRKNGITKIFKYATEKERQGYFKKFPELMFSKFAVPIGTGGLLGGEEEEQSEEGEGLLNINTKEAAPMTGVLDGIKSLPKEIMDIVNVKNNNLGNIKLNKKNDWDGQTNTGSKDTFANFTTPEYGVRALVKVVNANLRATNSYETYVNRYASEPKERAYYKKHGKLMKHLQNYAKVLAKSQGVKNTKSKPKDVDMFKWIIATAKAEGSTKSLQYFTDDVINKGIKMVTQKSK